MIMIASVLLLRATTSATGVRASAVPATSPATLPHTRQTVRVSTATETAPATALGPSTERLETPNSLTLAASTHRERGGLSTVTKPGGSNATKKKSCQPRVMLTTEAA
jgi:hypothetical protein